jgi:glutamate-1-semialdehyde 2,1-aminomutase
MRGARVDGRKISERFEARTRNSAKLFRAATEVTPGGVMAGIKYFDPYPVFMERARGSRVRDVDGNQYVDYLMSYGALILGHGSSIVRREMESVLRNAGTTVFGTPTETELEYGGLLRDIYHEDGLVRFTNSGLEATLLAVRLARGHTRRRKVAKFEGHYHGAVDTLLFNYAPALGASGKAQSPAPIGDSADVEDSILSESLVLPFNDWDPTERLLARHSRELACVIMEPFEEGVIAAEPKFMSRLRRLTQDLKIPLIFDEVKTGFRVRFGGASEFYSVMPDLTCLGKIIGGGLPIGAVVGDAEIMELLDPRGERETRVFHSGTFNGNPLSLSVGRATVEELRRRGRFSTLRSRTETLKKTMSAVLRSRQLPHVMLGEGAMFNFYITDRRVKNYRDAQSSDLRLRKFIDLGLISRGIYLKPENRFCLSTAHTAEDVQLTVDRFGEALDDVIQGPRRSP